MLPCAGCGGCPPPALAPAALGGTVVLKNLQSCSSRGKSMPESVVIRVPSWERIAASVGRQGRGWRAAAGQTVTSCGWWCWQVEWHAGWLPGCATACRRAWADAEQAQRCGDRRSWGWSSRQPRGRCRLTRSNAAILVLGWVLKSLRQGVGGAYGAPAVVRHARQKPAGLRTSRSGMGARSSSSSRR